MPLGRHTDCSSSVARAARYAARPRAGFQRTFQPKTVAPIVSQRFASGEQNVREGKIHQVIGAVVDSKSFGGPGRDSPS
jgi:hypothetical protein